MKRFVMLCTALSLLFTVNTAAYRQRVGDIDNNRAVNEKDAALLLRSVLSEEKIAPLYTFDVYDVDGNGEKDTQDAVAILNNSFTERKHQVVPVDSVRAAKMDSFIEYIFTLEDGDPSNGSAWNTEGTSAFKWSYINGCIASAFIRLYEATGNEKYKSYADNYMYGFINEDGSFKSGVTNGKNVVNPAKFALDDINSGKSMLEFIAYKSEHSEAYKAFLTDVLHNTVIDGYNALRTSEGNYFHKATYPCQVWLDGTYMVMPFLMQYEYDINKGEGADMVSDDVTKQFRTVYEKLRDKDTGLYYHGYCSYNDPKSKDYNENKKYNWASYNTKNPGCSQCVWLRGQAWYAMALIDTIELMEEGENKATLIEIYKELMDSILNYQNENGMWRQVIDGEAASENYFETSGTAGIAYALMKGYNLNLLSEKYYNAGLKAFNSVVDNKLSSSVKNGKTVYTLKDICQMAGLDDKGRDGSYTYYTSRTVNISNDAKGIAPLLLAYSEVLKHDQ